MTNVTLAIDDDLLRRARVQAIEEGTSVNEVVRDFLREHSGAASARVAAADAGAATLSVQVLQELYVTVTRKLAEPLHVETARFVVTELSAQTVVHTGADLVLRAVDLAHAEPISLWDTLIVEAARAGGCDTLYTEDLQAGGRYGTVRVVDPFAR